MDLSGLNENEFWNKVNRHPTDCWPWLGYVGKNGYGLLKGAWRGWYTHRVALALTHGLPDGMNALHKCDNPSCCRPSHLYSGTQYENVHDSINRGRWNKRKLTSTAVSDIRSKRMPQRAYAKKYNVSQRTILRVQQHTVYKGQV